MHRDRRTDRPDEVNGAFWNSFANVPKNGPYQHCFTLLSRRIHSVAQCDQSTAVKVPTEVWLFWFKFYLYAVKCRSIKWFRVPFFYVDVVVHRDKLPYNKTN
jgi:hypothetical protein